ncbi:hypothetical protein TEA_005645 [Camellia sinensis var. sinensis]|uniref:RCK N-terminal domain-containing protein n=1 Tax=Camellia sinensis var. sinensis TaxID=542762 RepID=A0A4S4E3R2_CAMSN|nr:hypothetical protein TEA_005645 [Camellia sinensis var. sinensis]
MVVLVTVVRLAADGGAIKNVHRGFAATEVLRNAHRRRSLSRLLHHGLNLEGCGWFLDLWRINPSSFQALCDFVTGISSFASELGIGVCDCRDAIEMGVRAVVAEHVFDEGDETSFVALHGELARDIVVVGRLFGISIISAIRVGLLLAPGGEFAFVAFGYNVLSDVVFAVSCGRGINCPHPMTDDLQDHIIICGFGRVGQIIAQLLLERLIPFVALDVRSSFWVIYASLMTISCSSVLGVLHKVGAERACAAAITLDTPGANYKIVWALSKYFPNVKTFVCADDVDHGLILEKAEATAVVPETLEPSLQLAAAVLAQAKLPMSEIKAIINKFRSHHLSELTELSEASGGSLGYGYSRIMSKPKSQPFDSSDDNQITEGTLVI